MSVILDALRKLDREKLSRRSGRGNIAAEILNPDLPRPGKRIPIYLVVIVLTALATAAITYGVAEFGFLRKSPPPAPPVTKATETGEPSMALSLAPASPPKPTSPSAMNPPAPAPAPGQQVAPSLLSREAVRDVQETARPLPPKMESPVEGKPPVERKPPVEAKPSSAPQSEKETGQRAPLEKTAPPPTPVKPAEQPPESSTPPPLKLSAIVWYEEASRRFAMVNGMIAYEGNLIEGVKVEEIHPDRVSFSHHGRFFEITLIK